MDIQEILRRVRAGQSDRAIHQELKVHRDTVCKYRQRATEQGRLNGSVPDVAVLQQTLARTQPICQPPQNVSSVEP